MSTAKPTKVSVTNFLYCGDKYLFLERSPHASINASQYNGIGGKLEPGEDYLSAAIRETQEESGYVVKPSDIRFCGIIRFETKHADDWITCFYKIQVPHTQIPIGNTIKEGNLHWIHKDDVLTSELHLVDDIRYIFPDIVEGKRTFFVNATVEGQDFKIVKVRTQYLL